MTAELESLHRAANQLYAAESLEECYQTTINAAVNILGLDWCTLVAPAEDADMFEVKAISENGTAEVGDRLLELDEGITGHVYQTKETTYLESLSASEQAKPTDNDIQSGLVVPVGDWGVFNVLSAQPDAFDQRDKNWTELLCLSLGTAIERKQRERQLKDKNEQLDEFASVISHDLRNPLNVAQLRLNLAREECDSEHLDQVVDAHDRMNRLIDDLLMLAREGKTISKTEVVDIEELVRTSWGNVEAATATVHTPVSHLIYADRGRLQQLFENLIRNAVEHGGETVTVTVGELEDGFYFEDDGPGIAAGNREDVFDSGYSTSDDGTGLGLNIVKKIVDAHGWDIDVTNGSDSGARFEITGVEFAE